MLSGSYNCPWTFQELSKAPSESAWESIERVTAPNVRLLLACGFAISPASETTSLAGLMPSLWQIVADLGFSEGIWGGWHGPSDDRGELFWQWDNQDVPSSYAKGSEWRAKFSHISQGKAAWFSNRWNIRNKREREKVKDKGFWGWMERQHGMIRSLALNTSF